MCVSIRSSNKQNRQKPTIIGNGNWKLEIGIGIEILKLNFEFKFCIRICNWNLQLEFAIEICIWIFCGICNLNWGIHTKQKTLSEIWRLQYSLIDWFWLRSVDISSTASIYLSLQCFSVLPPQPVNCWSYSTFSWLIYT